MRRVTVFMAVVLVSLVSQSVAQNTPHKKPFSTWNMYFPDVVAQGRAIYPIAVLTPTESIVIRRIEALSNKGPVDDSVNAADPVPCKGQYSLEITDGVVTQKVPISNTFVGKRTSQTYTDSGVLNWAFSAGNRITVSVSHPKEQFPPIHCTFFGLNVSVQYELAEPPQEKTSAPQ